MPPHLARALQELVRIQNHDVKHLQDKFAAATKDSEWIRDLGQEAGWVIISGDPRISRNPIEKAVWHESGLTAFFFLPPFQNSGFWKQAAELVRVWPTIADQARATPSGYGFTMRMKDTKLGQIYP